MQRVKVEKIALGKIIGFILLGFEWRRVFVKTMQDRVKSNYGNNAICLFCQKEWFASCPDGLEKGQNLECPSCHLDGGIKYI